jgi:hypothetical protein
MADNAMPLPTATTTHACMQSTPECGHFFTTMAFLTTTGANKKDGMQDCISFQPNSAQQDNVRPI